MNYRVYGVTLGSDVPLPELQPEPHLPPALFYTVVDRSLDGDGWRWIRPPSDLMDEPWVAVAVRGGDYRLVFDGGGDFLVSDQCRTITASMADGMSDDTVRHLLIDQVVPLVLGHLGALVLHASAFIVDGEAVALLGPAGAGKSTLSASFGMSGGRLVADDALVVEVRGGHVMAAPAYAGVRVWPDVLPALVGRDELPRVAPYSDKRRIGTSDGLAFASEAVPLRAIYALRPSPSSSIEVSSLSRREAAMALIGHAYILDVADRDRLREHFERASNTRVTALVRALSFPHELDALADVRDALLADMSKPVLS